MCFCVIFCNIMLERIHLKFCKILLNLKQTTPDFMIYGELGRVPLDIKIKTKIITYWTKLISGQGNKIASILYKLGYSLFSEHQNKFPWIKHIENVLNECGLSNIWLSQSFPNEKWLKSKVNLVLTDQFKQQWISK